MLMHLLLLSRGPSCRRGFLAGPQADPEITPWSRLEISREKGEGAVLWTGDRAGLGTLGPVA